MAHSARVIFIPFGMPHAREFVDKSEDWVKNRPGKGYQVFYWKSGGVVEALTSLDKNAEIYLRGHGTPGGDISCTYLYDGQQYNPIKKIFQTASLSDHLEVPMDVACQRLIDSGLPKSFAGDIKFYFCNSGTPPSAGDLETSLRKIDKTIRDADAMEAEAKKLGFCFRKDAKNQRDNYLGAAEAYRKKVDEYRRYPTPMAQRGAEYLRSRGYTNCKYYGYLGKLMGTYGTAMNEDEVPAKAPKPFADGKEHRAVSIDLERNPGESGKAQHRRAQDGRVEF